MRRLPDADLAYLSATSRATHAAATVGWRFPLEPDASSDQHSDGRLGVRFACVSIAFGGCGEPQAHGAGCTPLRSAPGVFSFWWDVGRFPDGRSSAVPSARGPVGPADGSASRPCRPSGPPCLSQGLSLLQPWPIGPAVWGVWLHRGELVRRLRTQHRSWPAGGWGHRLIL
jgi:hypothetical protein